MFPLIFFPVFLDAAVDVSTCQRVSWEGARFREVPRGSCQIPGVITARTIPAAFQGFNQIFHRIQRQEN